MRRRRWPAAWPTASWCSARWRRASSSASARRRRAAPPRARLRFNAPYGVMSPAQRYAMRAMRFLHENKIAPSAQRAIALASYHHAQANPRAVMHGRPLTAEAYDNSRWIVEPWRLFDCCQENDGAAALIIVPAEEAKDFKHKPAYLLGSAQGSEHRNGARGAQRAALRHLELHHGGAAALRHGGREAFRCRRGAELRELHRRRADEPGRARLLHGRGGQRLPHAGEPDGAVRQAAAQHLGRQPGRMLHARPRAAGRGGAPAARPVDVAGARTPTCRW